MPKRWRFRTDPQGWGEIPSWHHFGKQVYSIPPYFDPAYDDSGWEEVPASHVWKGEGAAWYRAGLWWTGAKDVSSLTGPIPALRSPGVSPWRGFGPLHRPSSSPQESRFEYLAVYVNAARIQPAPGQSLREAMLAALVPGYNLLAIQVGHWPHALPDPTGPEVGEVTWQLQRVGHRAILTVTQAEVHHAPQGVQQRPQRVRLRLVNPEKKVIARTELPSIYLPTRFAEPLRAELTEFGRYHLELTVGRQTRRWPFHFLGLCFFHGGGSDFQPDRSLEELLAHAATTGRKHHAWSQEGWLFEPLHEELAGESRAPSPPFKPSLDGLSRVRQAIADGQLDFVGMPYARSPLGAMGGEAFLRSLRYARHLYRVRLGIETSFFGSLGSHLTPQLPQILQLCGYDTCLIGEDGEGSENPFYPHDGSWKTPDGSTLQIISSYDHGLRVPELVRRAVRRGGKVALIAEEWIERKDSFPRPDRFWDAAQAEALVSERILLQPISLSEYVAALGRPARRPISLRDDQMAYPGWAGGTPSEIVSESLRHLTENHLTAVENLVAAAHLWDLPQGRISPEEIDRLWKDCLLYGKDVSPDGPSPSGREGDLRRIHQRVQELLQAAAVALARRVQHDREAVVVVNPLGWTRSGWVRVPVGEGPAFLALPNGVLTQQRAGEGEILFWAAEVPAVGWRTYKLLRLPRALPPEGPQVEVQTWGVHYVLENPYLRVAVAPDGRLSLQPAGRKLRPTTLHQLLVLKPEGDRPSAPLSTPDRPLNRDYYTAVPPGRMELLESGPARAIVRVLTSLPGCPGATVEQTFSLAAGARRVEIQLGLNFPTAQTLGDPHYPSGAAGPYVPGLFLAFPCSRRARLVVDQPYCLAHDVLRIHRSGPPWPLPFRHYTARGVSLAAPDSAEFALLTPGLTHFFLVPDRPAPFLGLSLGTGFGRQGPAPYQGEYHFEYALFLPESKESLGEAYTQARESQVPLQGIVLKRGRGDLPLTRSCFTTEEPSVPVTGVQLYQGQLRARVLALSEVSRTVTFRCPADLSNVALAPTDQNPPTFGGSVLINLPPRAVREIQAQVRR